MDNSTKYRYARYEKRVEIDGRLVAVEAPRHGVTSSYGNWGCRCVPCTEAHRVYTTQSRNKRKQQRVRRNGRWVTTQNVVHGRTSTRINYGCECDPCREAGNADRRERRWQRNST